MMQAMEQARETKHWSWQRNEDGSYAVFRDGQQWAWFRNLNTALAWVRNHEEIDMRFQVWKRELDNVWAPVRTEIETLKDAELVADVTRKLCGQECRVTIEGQHPSIAWELRVA